jgi:biotin carboxyl carrier protein
MADTEQVFLSYALEDLERARSIYAELKTRSVNVWFDKERLTPGEWKGQIQKAIAQSSYFIICLSDATLKKIGDSPGFQDSELNWAYDIAQAQAANLFTIIPLRLEDCDRGDHRLSRYQQFDLFADWDGVLDRLAIQLGGRSLSDLVKTDSRTEHERLLDGLVGKAIAFHYAGDRENAYSTWLAIEILDGKNAHTLTNKAIALFNLRKYQEALEACNEALELEPNQIDALYSRGQTLFYLRHYAAAVEDYDKVLLAQSGHPNALHGRRAALSFLGRPVNYVEVTAPVIGKFYNCGSPVYAGMDYFMDIDWRDTSDTTPYVELGDKVSEGTLLCRICGWPHGVGEIYSECSGRIIEILVKNGDPVEYGQPLFRIETDKATPKEVMGRFEHGLA